jgi:hypothetical protein
MVKIELREMQRNMSRFRQRLADNPGLEFEMIDRRGETAFFVKLEKSGGNDVVTPVQDDVVPIMLGNGPTAKPNHFKRVYDDLEFGG